MRKIDEIREECADALRGGDKIARVTLGDMLDYCRKQAIPKDSKSKPQELNDEFVDECLMKYQKMVVEEYESIPDDEKYAARKAEVQYKLDLVRRYAPQPITDKNEIINLLLEWRNQGVDIQSKKVVMPMLKKARVDMKVANTALAELKES